MRNSNLKSMALLKRSKFGISTMIIMYALSAATRLSSSVSSSIARRSLTINYLNDAEVVRTAGDFTFMGCAALSSLTQVRHGVPNSEAQHEPRRPT